MKFYRYFFRDYDTTVGIVKADNVDDARKFLMEVYGPELNFKIKETHFDDHNVCEVYYGG